MLTAHQRASSNPRRRILLQSMNIWATSIVIGEISWLAAWMITCPGTSCTISCIRLALLGCLHVYLWKLHCEKEFVVSAVQRSNEGWVDCMEIK
jgi:hypothetical protein